MRPRTIIVLLLLVRLVFTVNGQNTQHICQELIAFTRNADMDYYLERIWSDIDSGQIKHYMDFGGPALGPLDSMVGYCIPYSIPFGNRVIPVLCIEFKDMDSFDGTKSIYSHIIIDSTIVFVLFEVNKWGRTERILHFAQDSYPISDLTGRSFLMFRFSAEARSNYADYRKMRYALKTVKRKKPDLLLFCPRLGGGGKNMLSPISDLLYIKNNQIYLFRTAKRRSYEIDDYAHNLFQRVGSLATWSELETPNIYVTTKSTKARKAGYTPKEQIIIP